MIGMFEMTDIRPTDGSSGTFPMIGRRGRLNTNGISGEQSARAPEQAMFLYHKLNGDT
jgi:hypothetical protein